MSDSNLNLDDIFMDMDKLIEKYKGKIHSINNTNEIQQISLFCIQNRNDYRYPVLMDMINPTFSFAGLYPHIMKIDPDLSDKITKDGKEILLNLLKKKIK